MSKRGLFSTLFGFLFAILGILWIAAIFIRCDVHFALERSRGGSSRGISYQQIEKVIEEKIEQKKKENPKTFSLYKHVPKMFIWQFWLIACLELLCALLFLGAGISVLRKYPFKQKLVMIALAADAFLKGLIWTYYRFIFLPLNEVLEEKNILLIYFSPDTAIESKISLYLSGAKLADQGALYYACFYLVIWLAAIKTFTCPKIKD